MGISSKEERAKIVYEKYINGEGSLTDLSKKHGIRRETVWKWHKRNEEEHSIGFKTKTFLYNLFGIPRRRSEGLV